MPKNCDIVETTDGNGYGREYDPRVQRQVPAHRLAWERANGRELTADELLKNTCGNRACRTPEHWALTGRGSDPWERFQALSEPLPNGCILWHGGRTFYDGTRQVAPVRYLYDGCGPSEGRLRRTCATKGCIHPEHHTTGRLHGGDPQGRFRALCETQPTGCVHWEGGRTFFDGARQVAPRTFAYGPHEGRVYAACLDPDCVNPEHLRERPKGARLEDADYATVRKPLAELSLEVGWDEELLEAVFGYPARQIKRFLTP